MTAGAGQPVEQAMDKLQLPRYDTVSSGSGPGRVAKGVETPPLSAEVVPDGLQLVALPVAEVREEGAQAIGAAIASLARHAEERRGVGGGAPLEIGH